MDPDALLRTTGLSAFRVDRKGEPRLLKSHGPFAHSAVHVDVSDAEFSDLAKQIEDAVAFLEVHAAALRSATAFPGVEQATLDFAVESREVAIDSKYLPPDLLRRAGQLGIGVEISLYPPSDSST